MFTDKHQIITFLLIFYLLLQNLLLAGLLSRKKRLSTQLPMPLVKVTIMVAARNEEANILRCLQALDKLNYPTTHLQILIGNDQSTDSTEEIVREFIADKPHFELLNIVVNPVYGEKNLGQTQGKANVLAQLAQAAQGDWWLITDADIAVPVHWVETMLAARQNNKSDKPVGIVTGFTLVQGNTLFAKMQAIDWAYSLGLIKVWSDQNIPVTAMGNNLGISPEAYRKTGGYENIPFSITEDFALFRAIVKQGYGFRNVVDVNVTAFSQPLLTLKDWLHQRKRWMSGALQAPWFLSVFFALHGAFWVLVALLAFSSPVWAAGIGLAKLLSQSLFIGNVLKRVKQAQLIRYLLLFELYHVTFTWFMLVFYLLPVKVKWKGRRY